MLSPNEQKFLSQRIHLKGGIVWAYWRRLCFAALQHPRFLGKRQGFFSFDFS